MSAPPGVDSKGEPRWKEVSRTGRFEWHDHRMHWMAAGDPEAVKDKDVRTKVFDWKVPVTVDGQPGRDRRDPVLDAAAVLEPPLGAVFAFAALVIVICIAVVIVRRRRPVAEAW